MRILLLSPYPPLPARGGGALRILNLLRGLAERHTVTLLSFAASPAAAAAMAPLRSICRLATVVGPPPRSLARRALDTLTSPLPDMALRNADPAYAAALSRLLAAERFDVVQAESIEMAGYAMVARGLGARLVLDEFNAEYLLQRRAALADLRRGLLPPRPRPLVGGLYSLIQWRKLAAYEAGLLRAFDRVLAVSDEDRAALGRLARGAGAHIRVVPNGVDTAYFTPRGQGGPVATPGGPERAPALLVFTATLDYRPNVDGARWFVAEVLPLILARRPDARLLLVGRSPAPAVLALAGPAVEVVGEVPDVRPYIAAAAAYVVPMQIGGGSRLKLLEALAMGAPVVSTPVGAEGLRGLRDGEELLLAGRPREFAAAVLRLLGDPGLARRLGADGRGFAVRHYDWRAITPLLEASYEPT